VRREILAELKSSYLPFAYLSKTPSILESDGQLLKQMEQASDARFRSNTLQPREPQTEGQAFWQLFDINKSEC
jgi:hypothetical protein